MNYLLFHVGKIPDHFFVCINNILSVDSKANIFLVTDSNLEIKGLNILNIEEHDELMMKKNKILTIFKDTILETNPLWYASFLRVFGLSYASSHFKINKFVHFDNDVLIYKPFSKIMESGVIKKNLINITQIDETNLVFGYSYFDNLDNLKYLEDFFEKVLQNNSYYRNNFHKGRPIHEMRVLKLAAESNPTIFSILPSLPYQNETIFDPASYGQYLNGTHVKRGNFIFKKRWISTNHIVGRELKSKRIKVVFKNQQPSVFFQNKSYELVNLHVHSKNLNKFVSSNYREHFKKQP
jgi:hypothetical protein